MTNRAATPNLWFEAPAGQNLAWKFDFRPGSIIVFLSWSSVAKLLRDDEISPAFTRHQSTRATTRQLDKPTQHRRQTKCAKVYSNYKSPAPARQLAPGTNETTRESIARLPPRLISAQRAAETARWDWNAGRQDNPDVLPKCVWYPKFVNDCTLATCTSARAPQAISNSAKST